MGSEMIRTLEERFENTLNAEESAFVLGTLSPPREGEKVLGTANEDAQHWYSLYLLEHRYDVHRYADSLMQNKEDTDLDTVTRLETLSSIAWEAIRRQFPSQGNLAMRSDFRVVEIPRRSFGCSPLQSFFSACLGKNFENQQGTPTSPNMTTAAPDPLSTKPAETAAVDTPATIAASDTASGPELSAAIAEANTTTTATSESPSPLETTGADVRTTEEFID
jgi:hypothetical protein